MYQKILMTMCLFVLSCQLCFAQNLSLHLRQNLSSPTVATQNWNADFHVGLLAPLSFRDGSVPMEAYTPVSINWTLAELALRTADIRPGTPSKVAIHRLFLLGGREDGGLQLIPATRYYFSPGIIVNVPIKNGVVTGPLQLSPGLFSVD
jgi:hypothetical protein